MKTVKYSHQTNIINLKTFAMNKAKLFSIVILVCVMMSCSKKIDIEAEKQKMMQTDIEFSNLSVEKGLNESFLAYCANDGVLLRPNQLPIEGKDAISKKLSASDDKNFILKWSPSFGSIAESGELGYTYGTYEIISKDSVGNKEIGKGTYITIWKKDNNGNWKWVLDTGNQGLGAPVMK